MTPENDTLPEGTTLHLDSEALDAVEAATALPEAAPQSELKLTRDKFLQILRKMLASEQITRQQMLEMRRRFGISNASFTKKKADKAKQKRKKALAYRCKRTNRLNGAGKGQKRNNGRA